MSMNRVGMATNQMGRFLRFIQKRMTRNASPPRSWFMAPKRGQRMTPPEPGFPSRLSEPGRAGMEAMKYAVTMAMMVTTCLLVSGWGLVLTVSFLFMKQLKSSWRT